MVTVPNKMAVWLCIKADIGGKPSILLRGVNFRADAPSIKQVNGPWLHVPSISYEFEKALDVKPHAVHSKTIDKIRHDWPGLSAAMMEHKRANDIVGCINQDLTGHWSGTRGQALVTPVTRIVIDLGRLKMEPQIIFRPGEQLPFARDPVFWVPVDDVTQTPGCVPVDQGVRHTPYTLSGTHTVVMETDNKGGKAVATIQDMAFQETVADGFKAFFGDSLFPTREYAKSASTLTLRPIHG